MAALMPKGTPETLEKSISFIKFWPKLTDLYQRSCEWVIWDITAIYKMYNNVLDWPYHVYEVASLPHLSKPP